MQPAPETTDPRTPLPRRRLAWALGLIVVVFVASGVLVWVLVHGPSPAHALCECRAVAAVPQRAGGTVYLDSGVTTRRATQRLEVGGVAPLVRRNSSHARIQVLVCARRPGPDGFGEGNRADLSTSCRTVRTFRPGTLTLGSDRTQLVYEITPRRAGRLVIAGTEVSYHDGSHPGDQRCGLKITVTTR